MPLNSTSLLAQKDELANFFEAAYKGDNAAIMAYLNKNGLDAIDRQDDDGWTALMCAATTNNIATIGLLVENGASLEIQSKSGKTPAKLLRIYADTNTIVDLVKFIEEQHKRKERLMQEQQEQEKNTATIETRLEKLKMHRPLKPILRR